MYGVWDASHVKERYWVASSPLSAQQNRRRVRLRKVSPVRCLAGDRWSRECVSNISWRDQGRNTDTSLYTRTPIFKLRLVLFATTQKLPLSGPRQEDVSP